MILVDTSIWIDHLRQQLNDFELLLVEESICSHPFIVGELACGNLHNRQEIIQLLKHLPQAAVASDDEVLEFIMLHQLAGKGLGYIDMHLLAASKLSALKLWTKDRRLNQAATQLNISWIHS